MTISNGSPIQIAVLRSSYNQAKSRAMTIQGSHRPGKVLEFDLGPGKLLEFQNSAICPGIVLEFCKIALENVKLSLKIIKYTDSFPFFWIYAMRERKLCENRWIR